MASKTSLESAKVASPGELGDSKAASKIRFSATLLRPKATAKAVSWTFLTLPKEESAKLPSRSMTSVEGTFNGLAFQATLEPDGHALGLKIGLHEGSALAVNADDRLDYASTRKRCGRLAAAGAVTWQVGLRLAP